MDERQHLLECEARWVLSNPLKWRRDYLKRIGMRRGDVARKKLENAIAAEWEKGRGKKA